LAAISLSLFSTSGGTTARTSFGKRIAHGLYTASLISAVLGTRLPGPGAIYISQTLNFRGPVKIGDTVLVTVTVQELIAEKSRATIVHLLGR
jgi:3-hydroxybutyryl-CoA dehydratase